MAANFTLICGSLSQIRLCILFRMNKHRDIPEKAYELAILLSTVIWGGSYVVLKGAFDAIGPGWLLGIRFIAGALILALIFHKRVRENMNAQIVRAGASIGLWGGLAFLAQNLGLSGTTPGRNAFLTATYCVMAPFACWALEGVRPRVRNVVAAFICIVGVGFLSLAGEEGSFSFYLSTGDWLTVLGAFFYAIQFVAIGKHAPNFDPIALTVPHLLVQGSVCLLWGLFMEAPPTASIITPMFLWQLGYLVVLATVVAATIQNVAQQHVSPTQAALLFSLESVFGTFFSVIFFHEVVTFAMFLGCALIFVAVVVSELPGK